MVEASFIYTDSRWTKSKDIDADVVLGTRRTAVFFCKRKCGADANQRPKTEKEGRREEEVVGESTTLYPAA